MGMAPRAEPPRVSDHVTLTCHVTGDALSLRGARIRWVRLPRDYLNVEGNIVARFLRPLISTQLPWRRSEARTCAGTIGSAIGLVVREEDMGADFRCDVVLTNGSTFSSQARLVLLTRLSAEGFIHN